MSIELNSEQVYATYDIEKWWKKGIKQVFEVVGPAGSGKTTFIRYAMDKLGIKLENVLFCAYMGKAANQLNRQGLSAKTIHSAIYDYRKVIDRDEEGNIVFLKNGKPKLKGSFILKEKIGKKVKLIVVDEGSMVDPKVAKDLLSFGIPIIVLGDLNQLPPVFGKPFFLVNPDVIFTKIMRQNENSPIIWLSQEILAGRKLKYGVYGNCAVIRKSDITEFHFRNADAILTETNMTRYNINNFCREEIKGIKQLDYPHIGEKVICRKNNWDKCIDKNLYLTNGTAGIVEHIYKESKNKRTMTMDFRPDYTNKSFKGITFDYNHLYAVPGADDEEANYYYDKMEFAYAITVHLSQGSQYPSVLYMNEGIMRNEEDKKKMTYTGITRAMNSIIVVI